MRVTLAFLMIFSLGACSQGSSISSLNPFGWFRGGTGQNTIVQNRGLAPRGGFSTTQDTRQIVGNITGLSADRTATGVIIRATALLPSEGFYAADLVLIGITERGVATYQFRANPPASVRRNVPAHLRQIVAAVYLTTAQARAVRGIQVQGAHNSRTVRP